jgi:hypothetical protein
LDTPTDNIQENEQEQTTYPRLCDVQNNYFLPATIRGNNTKLLQYLIVWFSNWCIWIHANTDVTDTWKCKSTGKHKCLTNSTTKTLGMSLPAEKQLSANISKYQQHSADISNESKQL